jgi:aldehyde:ferredoxin oxidoreductase
VTRKLSGFYKRLLTIDLTTRSFGIDPLPEEMLKQYLGGKGLATRLLLDLNPANANPLGPDNHFIIATGPFCGGRLWGGSRYGVFTKSPATGFYTESYSGGKTPEAIDAAGFDAIVIHGAADSPTALTITPDTVIFHDAAALWGMDTVETEVQALARFTLADPAYPKAGAISIGPAGERLVRCAIIANDNGRCAGRTGVGAVLGAKKLKTIVFQGDRKRQLADAAGAATYSKEFLKKYRIHPAATGYRKLGTSGTTGLVDAMGAFPTKYWRDGRTENRDKLVGEAIHRELDITPRACAKCFLACGRATTVREGRHKGLKLDGPEYETIFGFGGLCMINDVAEICHLNDVCDRYGIDTISAANLCALAMELVEQGRADFDIEYANAEKTAIFLKRIASRVQEGDLFADGIIKVAQTLNADDVAVHVKGLEPPGYDPRKLKGMGLAYATSPRGACHLRATFYKPELSGIIEPDSIEGKAALFIEYEDRLNIFDTLILCRFYRDLYSWEELTEAVSLATGIEYDQAGLQDVARRVADMTREFNVREGLTANDDVLPRLIHEKKLPDGCGITTEELGQMLQDYYRLRGWDNKGVPKFCP